jgi:hypothetical protein
MDLKALLAQLLAERAKAIEAKEDEPVPSVEAPRHASGQDFAAPHLQAQQHLADCGDAAGDSLDGTGDRPADFVGFLADVKLG